MIKYLILFQVKCQNMLSVILKSLKEMQEISKNAVLGPNRVVLSLNCNFIVFRI